MWGSGGAAPSVDPGYRGTTDARAALRQPNEHTMKRRTPRQDPSAAFERSYATALRKHVKTAEGTGAGGRLGRRARTLGVETLALARIHDRAAATLASSAGAVGRGDAFFAEAVAPPAKARRGAPEALAEGAKRASAGDRRVLAAMRARLAREVERREALEVKLKAGARARTELVERARRTEERLRHVSRRLLSAHEEERQRGRDYHP